MSKAPPYWIKARTYLSKKDSIMRSLIKKYKDNNLTTRKDVFYSLCKSIIGQQISVAAADSVFKKFELACKKKLIQKLFQSLKHHNLKNAVLVVKK